MLDFLGVNFLAIIYNLWLLTTKIMIGDKKKISPQYSILYSSKFGHIWMLNPCTTSQFRRRIRNSWFLKGSVWFTVQFWWQAFVICIWVSFHSYIKLGRSQGGGSIFGISLHFYVGISNFFPISDPDSHAHLPIYRMDSSNAYFDYLYFGSLFLSKKSIPDLEKKN